MWSRTIDHLFCGLFAPIQDQYSIPKQDSIPVGCILPLGNRTCFGDHHYMSVLCWGEGGRGQGGRSSIEEISSDDHKMSGCGSSRLARCQGEGYRRMGGVGTQSDMWAGGWVLRSDV